MDLQYRSCVDVPSDSPAQQSCHKWRTKGHSTFVRFSSCSFPTSQVRLFPNPYVAEVCWAGSTTGLLHVSPSGPDQGPRAAPPSRGHVRRHRRHCRHDVWMVCHSGSGVLYLFLQILCRFARLPTCPGQSRSSSLSLSRSTLDAAEDGRSLADGAQGIPTLHVVNPVVFLVYASPLQRVRWGSGSTVA